jgi:F1F0 ATPase subunit 2
MVNDILTLILALMAGLILGGFFFGGLWWTVQKGLTSKYGGFWFLGSMLVRTGVVVAGFYFISGGIWQRLVACLAGFIIARFITLRLKHQNSESKINES